MDDFSIAAIFSDNMVLQRNRCVSFFGEAKGDFCVSVSIFDKKGDVLSQNKCFSQDGKWICRLEPLTAQDDCKVAISATNSLSDSSNNSSNAANSVKLIETTFSNVSTGEVWLAGGQSNMVQMCVFITQIKLHGKMSIFLRQKKILAGRLGKAMVKNHGRLSVIFLRKNLPRIWDVLLV